MFTAREFLTSPQADGTWASLPARLSSDPERLGREFLAIAADPDEPDFIRARALLVLFGFARVLQIDSLEAEVAFGRIFELELAPARLREIGTTLRRTARCPEAVFALFAAIAFAALSPGSGILRLRETEQAFRGTPLEAGIKAAAKHLELGGRGD